MVVSTTRAEFSKTLCGVPHVRSSMELFTGPDPTNGHVQFVDMETAKSTGLAGIVAANDGYAICLGADTKSVAPQGRQSIRLKSKKTHNNALWITEIGHLPVGPRCWPAYWLLGTSTTPPYGAWPASGEKWRFGPRGRSRIALSSGARSCSSRVLNVARWACSSRYMLQTLQFSSHSFVGRRTVHNPCSKFPDLGEMRCPIQLETLSKNPATNIKPFILSDNFLEIHRTIFKDAKSLQKEHDKGQGGNGGKCLTPIVRLVQLHIGASDVQQLQQGRSVYRCPRPRLLKYHDSRSSWFVLHCERRPVRPRPR